MIELELGYIIVYEYIKQKQEIQCKHSILPLEITFRTHFCLELLSKSSLNSIQYNKDELIFYLLLLQEQFIFQLQLLHTLITKGKQYLQNVFLNIVKLYSIISYSCHHRIYLLILHFHKAIQPYHQSDNITRITILLFQSKDCSFEIEGCFSIKSINGFYLLIVRQIIEHCAQYFITFSKISVQFLSGAPNIENLAHFN
ncbi:unnamed protein product [Paramecium octaurelia]|uniref:Uncharacterized protein n=1 Tax=Paramecium octaurelia TaxID=43137 RepID=A0A8S1WI88_PAROT|nr:unnamed protein product [Paramecium octaurelia]